MSSVNVDVAPGRAGDTRRLTQQAHTPDAQAGPSGPRPSAWRILADSGEREPRLNLALDEAVARKAGALPTLRLWRNGACAVVGRFQVADAEVDRDASNELRVPVYRRFTGGGTVYHDGGNLNISVVMRRADPLLLARPELGRLPDLYRLVLDPLAAAVRSLGPATEITERGLFTAGAKIGGVAAWIGADAILVHATLLVDADLTALRRVLDGPGAPGNARWEHTRSRRSPVTTLVRAIAELRRAGDSTAPVQQLDPGSVDLAVITAFAGGGGGLDALSSEEAGLAEALMERRYARPSWHELGT